MTLYIDTTQGDDIEIALEKGARLFVRKKFKAKRKQAERLLREIDKLLKTNSLRLNEIKKVKVMNTSNTEAGEPTSFTALRIGVVTANAFAYALGITVESHKKLQKVTKSYKKLQKVPVGFTFHIVEPIYDRAANITIKRRKK